MFVAHRMPLLAVALGIHNWDYVGTTEIPFEFPLKARPGQTLYETYHGVFVNIQVCREHHGECDVHPAFLPTAGPFQIELASISLPSTRIQLAVNASYVVGFFIRPVLEPSIRLPLSRFDACTSSRTANVRHTSTHLSRVAVHASMRHEAVSI
jgi:hypothetical protein